MIALIIAGGAAPGLEAGDLPAADFIVAADSGLDHARVMHLSVDVLVGDLDSVSAISLRWAQKNGIRIEAHDADKDQTDLELAMHAAVAAGATRLVVVGGLGGRLDHLLATIGLLGSDAFADHDVELRSGHEVVHVVRSHQVLDAEVGTTVTLLAQAGSAEGVTTSGMRWELNSATLVPGATRGVSNIVDSAPATVSVAAGVLLAILSA